MNLPIDPDLDATPWPRLHWDVVLVVFVGGALGGWARYAITSSWAAGSGSFPWATLGVNVAGAFILALVIVAATHIVSSRYLRPLVGTGFCGALTTFSSIVVTTDLLFAHHHQSTAVAYLVASIAGGLAAVTLGLVLARAVADNRLRARGRKTTS